MIEKLLEAFFRHTLLILLPVFVLPVVVAAAVLSTPPQYEAQAAMWVEQARYLTYSDDFNQWISPAQNQRNRLVELMRTRSFLVEIASRTAVAPGAESPSGTEQLAALFARDFDVFASGEHLLTLRFRAEDRALARAVLDSMIAAFKARAAADRYGQAQVAIAFYQTRLMATEGALLTARNTLTKYVAENPSVAARLSQGGVETARLDPPFAEAMRLVDAAQRDADVARASLVRAELDVAAGAQGLEFGFRIVDPVQASATPSRQLKKVLLYPIVALIVGLVLSASLLLLFALSDRSVRSLADLAPDTVILGVLPHLRPHGLARRPGPAATRRAVGFSAGAPIPLRGRRRKAS